MFRATIPNVFLRRVLGACALAAAATACAEVATPTDPRPEARPAPVPSAALAAAPAPHPWVGRVVQVFSVYSAPLTPVHCLEVKTGIPAVGQDVIHAPCLKDARQYFQIVQAPTSPARPDPYFVHLLPVRDRTLCLDIRILGSPVGARTQLDGCTNGTDQTYKLPAPVAGGTVGMITTEVTGFGMALEATSPFASLAVEQYPITGAANQRWRFWDVVSGRWL